MIDYIIHHQNSFVYSHLFENNLVDLIHKGVEMDRLLDSEVFNYVFDYDEWPTTSTDSQKILAPYNGSMFKLRYEYPKIFEATWRKE